MLPICGEWETATASAAKQLEPMYEVYQQLY